MHLNFILVNVKYELLTPINFAFYVKKLLFSTGLVFVSPRCVQSVVECYKKENIEKKNEWKNRLCFVVGEATARSVSRDLDLSYSGSTSGNMKALLQTIDPSKSDLTEQNLREGFYSTFQ